MQPAHRWAAQSAGDVAALNPHDRGPSRQSKPRQGDRLSWLLADEDSSRPPWGRGDLGLWAAGPGVLGAPAAMDSCLSAPDTLGTLLRNWSKEHHEGKCLWPLTQSPFSGKCPINISGLFLPAAQGPQCVT